MIDNSSRPKILFVEDDVELSASVVQFLSENEFQVASAYNYNDALAILKSTKVAAAIVDVMLPSNSGLELCSYITESFPAVPVIIVTALSSEQDRLSGFEAGSDDYLVKPFLLSELLARVRVLVRRNRQSDAPSNLTFAMIEIDAEQNLAFADGKEVKLTLREIQIAIALIKRAGIVISRATLIAEIWDNDENISTNNVDQYIRRLRTKLFTPKGGCEIETIHGIGYRLKESK
ncbi:MAG: response regulator transcription factor [Actinomycetota bacterium]|nr:response regulator transcription factor [Actinomycetota bacterium]